MSYIQNLLPQLHDEYCIFLEKTYDALQQTDDPVFTQLAKDYLTRIDERYSESVNTLGADLELFFSDFLDDNVKTLTALRNLLDEGGKGISPFARKCACAVSQFDDMIEKAANAGIVSEQFVKARAR